MNSKLVLAHELLLEKGRVGDCTRADNKERGLEIVDVKVVEQLASVKSRSVIVRETPRELVGARYDIIIGRAPTARPPAATRVRGSLGVCRAATCDSRLDIGDFDARGRNLGNPLLHLVRVDGG